MEAVSKKTAVLAKYLPHDCLWEIDQYVFAEDRARWRKQYTNVLDLMCRQPQEPCVFYTGINKAAIFAGNLVFDLARRLASYIDSNPAISQRLAATLSRYIPL